MTERKPEPIKRSSHMLFHLTNFRKHAHYSRVSKAQEKDPDHVKHGVTAKTASHCLFKHDHTCLSEVPMGCQFYAKGKCTAGSV